MCKCYINFSSEVKMGIYLRVFALGAKFLPIFIFTSVTIVSASVPFKDYYRLRSGSTHPANRLAGVDIYPVPVTDYISLKDSFQTQDQYQKYSTAYYKAMANEYLNYLEEEKRKREFQAAEQKRLKQQAAASAAAAEAASSSEDEAESDESAQDDDHSSSEEEDHDKKTHVHHHEPPHHQDKQPAGIKSHLNANFGINLKLPKLKLPSLPYISIPVPRIPKVSLSLEYPEEKKPEHHGKGWHHDDHEDEKESDEDEEYEDERKGRRAFIAVVAPKPKHFQSRGKLLQRVKVKTSYFPQKPKPVVLGLGSELELFK